MHWPFGPQSLESTAEQLRLRSMDFLQDHDIELFTEKEVSSEGFRDKSVESWDICCCKNVTKLLKWWLCLVHWVTAKHTITYWNLEKTNKKIYMDNDKFKLIRHYRKVSDCMASLLGTHLSSMNSLFAQNIKCIENVSVFTVYQSLSKCVILCRVRPSPVWHYFVCFRPWQ